MIFYSQTKSKLFHVLILLMPGLVLCLTLPLVENLDFCLGIMGHSKVEVPRATPRMLPLGIPTNKPRQIESIYWGLNGLGKGDLLQAFSHIQAN